MDKLNKNYTRYEQRFLPCPICNYPMKSLFAYGIKCYQCGLEYPVNLEEDIDRWNNRNILIDSDKSFEEN